MEAVDKSLRAKEKCMKMLQFYLARAQHRMKTQVDKRRVEAEFQESDMVYVRLQPYKQSSVATRACHKLVVKYFGPFPVITRVGKVAYRLQLPPTAKVHPVFHVSQLKKHVGNAVVQGYMPEIDEEGLIQSQPVAILDKKLGK